MMIYNSLSFLFLLFVYLILFFFNDPPTTEIYTLSLHDALPICVVHVAGVELVEGGVTRRRAPLAAKVSAAAVPAGDRKSTRLNSSHPSISYAVFCLKKKTRT